MPKFLEQRQAVADLLIEPRDTLTIYINGEYFPAKIEHHDNDVVSQFVVVVDDAIPHEPNGPNGPTGKRAPLPASAPAPAPAPAPVPLPSRRSRPGANFPAHI